MERYFAVEGYVQENSTAYSIFYIRCHSFQRHIRT